MPEQMCAISQVERGQIVDLLRVAQVLATVALKDKDDEIIANFRRAADVLMEAPPVSLLNVSEEVLKAAGAGDAFALSALGDVLVFGNISVPVSALLWYEYHITESRLGWRETDLRICWDAHVHVLTERPSVLRLGKHVFTVTEIYAEDGLYPTKSKNAEDEVGYRAAGMVLHANGFFSS